MSTITLRFEVPRDTPSEVQAQARQLVLDALWCFERIDPATRACDVTKDGLALIREMLAAPAKLRKLRPCEVCDGPGPCLYDTAGPNVQRYACKKCHSNPAAPFFDRSSA